MSPISLGLLPGLFSEDESGELLAQQGLSEMSDKGGGLGNREMVKVPGCPGAILLSGNEGHLEAVALCTMGSGN